ncbi:hypothetical protein EIP91_010109 [Steccherinum ochraceum]|uniref:Uncharacterized protein n=1 Tax=Steccherinum ochraceum TaxID=92696 RepID=A0A4R0RUZ0_9APHY|nr:hypothetical protein EIP91_010109 [Steccherinum ochraceum]
MSTRSSTIVGIGTLTGRGLMFVGTGVIRAISYVALRRELSRIASAQRKSAPWAISMGMAYYPPLDPALYSLLVELQRPGLYPQDITVGAWNLMLVELGRRHEEQLLHAFSGPQLTPTDLQIFVEQLSICALSEWQKYPHRKRDVKLEFGLYSPNNLLEHPDGEGMLGEGLLHVLFLVLSRDPPLLHEIFDIDEFTLVLCACAATPWTIPDNRETGFDARTCHILRSIRHLTERRLQYPVIKNLVGCFAAFILHRTPSISLDLGVVVHTMAQMTAQDDALAELMRDHLDLVLSLCEENTDVATFFCGLRPIVAVRRLWSSHSSSAGEYVRFVNTIAKHQSVHQLSKDLGSKEASFLIEQQFLTRWDRAGLRPYDMGVAATGVGQVKWFLAGFQNTLGNSPEHSPPLEASRLLAHVIGANMPHAIREDATLVFFSALLLPREEDRIQMMHHICQNMVDAGDMMTFIIEDYLGSKGS